MIALLGVLVAMQVEVTSPSRPDCPTAAAIARDIETLIGVIPPPPIDVRIEVLDRGEGVVAELTYTAGPRTHTRSIPGSTCADVVNAAAVVVAVGVDPVAVQHTLAPILQRPSRDREPPLVVAPPPALPRGEAPRAQRVPALAQPPPPSSRPRRRRPSLGAFARGGVGVGGLPSPTGWMSGGLQLGLGGLRVEASAQHLFAQRVEHPDDASTGADVSITGARPAACWTPRVGAFTLGGCAGFDVGAIRGEGFGLENNGTATSLWVAATPGLRVHWHPSPRFGLGLSLDVPVSLVRPALTIDDFRDPLVRPGFAAVWAGLSLQFTFFDESPARRR